MKTTPESFFKGNFPGTLNAQLTNPNDIISIPKWNAV